jgi:hypothetical protein
VQALPEFFLQNPQLSLPPLAHRLSQYREMPLPSFPAAMGKTQEVKRLRCAATTVSPIFLRKAAKLDDSRFVGVQLKSEPRESFAQFRQKLLCFLLMLGIAFRLSPQRRHPGVPAACAAGHVFHGSLPNLYVPLSTLRRRPRERLRMTRGRCGSLFLQRMKLSFTTPFRF